MDLEFDAAAKRFSKDQDKRRQKVVDRKAQEAKEKAALQAKKERWAKEAAERREAEMARQAALDEQRDIDLEKNRGVAFVRSGLRPQLSLAAEAKGIRRANDKISLPHSCKAELDLQHASKNGQLFFVLSTPTGRSTSASILDFSAPEGTVGAPATVLRCLGLEHVAAGQAAAASETVEVRYTVLKVGTFARVQPVLSAFASDVSDVKATLEAEMLLRTTLSVGDTLSVREFAAVVGADGGSPIDVTDDAAAPAAAAAADGTVTAYELRIIALEPESHVSLIDTDLSVDVLPSAAASLPAEPDTSEPEAISVAVRCPDGTRVLRRFLRTTPLVALFAAVEASAFEALPDGDSFTLSASYPRRVFRRADAADGSRSLFEAGLTSKQEALMLELVSVEEAMDVS